MDEQIRQIAERICGLRDALDLTIEEMAGKCGMSADPSVRDSVGCADVR